MKRRAPISVLGMAPAKSCRGSTAPAEPFLRPGADAAAAVCWLGVAFEAIAAALGLLLVLLALLLAVPTRHCPAVLSAGLSWPDESTFGQ